MNFCQYPRHVILYVIRSSTNYSLAAATQFPVTLVGGDQSRGSNYTMITEVTSLQKYTLKHLK